MADANDAQLQLHRRSRIEQSLLQHSESSGPSGRSASSPVLLSDADVVVGMACSPGGTLRRARSSDSGALLAPRPDRSAQHAAVRRLAASLGVDLLPLDVAGGPAFASVPEEHHASASVEPSLAAATSTSPSSPPLLARRHSAADAEDDGRATPLADAAAAGAYTEAADDDEQSPPGAPPAPARVAQLEDERDSLVDRLLATTEALHASEARCREGAAAAEQVGRLMAQLQEVLRRAERERDRAQRQLLLRAHRASSGGVSATGAAPTAAGGGGANLGETVSGSLDSAALLPPPAAWLHLPPRPSSEAGSFSSSGCVTPLALAVAAAEPSGSGGVQAEGAARRAPSQLGNAASSSGVDDGDGGRERSGSPTSALRRRGGHKGGGGGTAAAAVPTPPKQGAAKAAAPGAAAKPAAAAAAAAAEASQHQQQPPRSQLAPPPLLALLVLLLAALVAAALVAFSARREAARLVTELADSTAAFATRLELQASDLEQLRSQAGCPPCRCGDGQGGWLGRLFGA